MPTPHPAHLHRIETTAADASGRVLSTVIRGVAALRPARKPLHPRGRVVRGRLHRRGSDPTTGVPWLDEPGVGEVLVRVSQAVGLPSWLPDIQGLALRTDPDGQPGDLLFATTGRGRVTRFLLTPSRGLDRPMTTLLPYRTPTGPVLLGARRTDEHTFELSWATASGPWRDFAGLVLLPDGEERDPEISFDPVRNEVPGLDTYGWVRRLREPSYLQARRSRS
jgi:hypothetical protein